MGEIVDFPMPEEVTVETALDEAADRELDHVLIVGIKDDGDMIRHVIIDSGMSVADANYMLDVAKTQILRPRTEWEH